MMQSKCGELSSLGDDACEDLIHGIYLSPLWAFDSLLLVGTSAAFGMFSKQMLV